MWTGFRRCSSREPTTAQASRDTGQLPPWLKDAQDSAVVARLRRNLETRGDKPYLGNTAGRVPSLVGRTSEGPEAGSKARRRAYCTRAGKRIVDNLPKIDIEDINDPAVGKNEIYIRAAEAEKEVDRLRIELSEVKEQLDNAEMAAAKVVDELLSSKRELNATRDLEQQLSMHIDALLQELEGSANALENAAKKAETELAILQGKLEEVKSELAGKTSELNVMKPQLDLARMQLRIFQETHVSSFSQVKVADITAQQADEELASIKAEFGAMNEIGVNQHTELVPVDPGKVLAELNKEHSQADRILKLEAELESAHNAQVVLQDAWWMMKEPSYNMLRAENQNMALRVEVSPRGSKLAITQPRNQARNNDTWLWEVLHRNGVNVRVAKSLKSAIIGSKDAGSVVCGRQECGWVALTEEPGFMQISESGKIFLRKLQLYVMVCH